MQHSRCIGCGAPLPATAKFCPECAHPVAGRAVAQPRHVPPETYTPKHLAEKILTARSTLEGERKQVTVLFADLQGSMELLADLDPEEARRLLDPVLAHMMEAVHHYEGTVNQVMGDGIMALFGAPLAHEDHAVRACYAALRMQASVKQYAEVVRRTEALAIQMRVGLNSGEVVVRSIANDLHMDYSAVGPTTHLASRMERLATPGTVLITADTLRLVEGFVDVRPLGPINIKGLSAPVEVYEVLGSGTVRSRFEAAVARGLTRLVGRNAEMDQLRRVQERALGGDGQIVAMVGEPGVGKSRLVLELTRSDRTQGWLVLESGAMPYGKAIPYLPVITLLRAYFGIEGGDDSREIREKVAGRLAPRGLALPSDRSALLALLGVPVTDDPAWTELDPLQRRQRTLEVVKRLLLRASRVQPLLLVVEDLQWIDSETQSLLDSVVDGLGATPVLLLVTYRPEYRHGWAGRAAYTELRIDPLPPPSAEKLLEALAGTRPELRAVKRLLIERTEGNPFFLEESVRTLVEMRVLAGERGAYRMVRPLAGIRVPPTVEAVLASRIDRLPAEEKRLLQSASVIGREVPLALLRAIAEEPDEALQSGLAHLQAAEFLYETRRFPAIEYTFKHTLTNEVAYGGLLHERRKALHAKIVQVLEALHPGRVDDLAHHALHGELWEKAVAYFWEAGTRAATRSAHREAVTCLEHALAALERLPESPRTVEQAIDLRFDLRNALHPLGEFSRIVDHLRDAEALARDAGDQRRLGQVSAYLTQYFWWMGNPDQAIESGHRALAIAKDLGDFVLHVIATFGLGVVHHSLGDYRRAIDVLETTMDSLTGDLRHERFGLPGPPSVFFRVWLVQCLAELGEFARAIALGEEARAIAEAVERPFSRIQAHYGLGFVYLRKRALDRAIPIFERSLGLCETWNIPIWFPRIASALGYAYALSGRTTEALPLLEQAVERATSQRILFGYSLAAAWLSEAYLLAGRVDDATAHAEHALALPREHGERGYEAWAWRLLAEIASRRDPPDVAEAESRYGRSLALAEQLGMRPLLAHCHQGLGALHRRAGRAGEADDHFATAARLFRELDMPLR